MFSKLFSLLLVSLVAFGQTQINSPDSVRTLKDFKNYVINPDAAKNITTGVVNASSIMTHETGASRLDGSASFLIDGTASAQVVKFTLNSLPNKFKGSNAECSFSYSYTTTNASGDYKFYAESSAGAKVSAEQNLLTTDGNTRSNWIAFSPASTLSNPYRLVIESTVASPAAMLVDTIY